MLRTACSPVWSPSRTVHGIRTAWLLIVMPRSRSMSMRSRYCARICRGSTTSVSCSMRSASVDLPWSMWAMMQKLRMRAGSVAPGVAERRWHGGPFSSGGGSSMVPCSPGRDHGRMRVIPPPTVPYGATAVRPGLARSARRPADGHRRAARAAGDLGHDGRRGLHPRLRRGPGHRRRGPGVRQGGAARRPAASVRLVRPRGGDRRGVAACRAGAAAALDADDGGAFRGVLRRGRRPCPRCRGAGRSLPPTLDRLGRRGRPRWPTPPLPCSTWAAGAGRLLRADLSLVAGDRRPGA